MTNSDATVEVLSETDDEIVLTIGLCRWHSVSTGRVIFEEDYKIAGETWRVHLNDADPFPSRPHAHCMNGSYQGCKLHLGTSELFCKKGSTGRKLNAKQFEILLAAVSKKFPDIAFPLSA